MTPLVHPSYDYISRAPYIVTNEWPDRHVSVACPTIHHALLVFWSVDFTHAGAPVERLVVDARGTHVLGYRDDVDDIHAWAMTDEVRREMERACPEHAEQFFEMEMATRGLNVLREERHAPYRL